MLLEELDQSAALTWSRPQRFHWADHGVEEEMLEINQYRAEDVLAAK